MPTQRTDPAPTRPDRFWPVVALIAVVLAASGWTAFGMTFVLRPAASAAPSAAAIDESFDPVPEESFEPEPESHEAADLEELLPADYDGTELLAQSWTGTTLLTDDPWSTAFTAALADKQKVPADLAIAQAWDPAQAIDVVVGAFRVNGVEPADVATAMTAAWTAQDDTFTTEDVTIAGKTVSKGTYPNTDPEPDVSFYWYEADGVVYDIETTDEAVATAVIQDIVGGVGSSPAPASGGPSGSPPPSGSPAP
jgi:hypothetical protein